MVSQKFYEQVVRVTYVYLGPAADRFVTRQIANHLDKKPEQLTKQDLPELIDWIRLAMGFLTQDKQLVDDYINRLQALHEMPRPKVKTHAHKTN
jgi:hypothetical protein